MTAPAAFQATFVDVQTIRTRSVVKLVMEVPVEQAGAALEALGGIPIPGKEPWVAIARLDPTKAKEPPAADAKPKERRPFHSLPRSQQAALACNDGRFRQWAPFSRSTISADLTEKEREATIASDIARHLRETLGVQSRRDLDMNDEAGARWDALYDRYLRETGQQTERRG